MLYPGEHNALNSGCLERSDGDGILFLMLTFKDVTKDEHLVSPKQPKYKRGFHPNSRKNLLGPRWQKGQSGNPTGYSLTSALKDALRKPLKRLESGSSAAEELIYSTIQGAINLEPAPFHEVWNRLEGKVPGNIPAGYQDTRSINVIVSNERAKELTENVSRRLLKEGKE